MYDMGPYENGGPNATAISFTLRKGSRSWVRSSPLAPHRYFDEMFRTEIGTYEGKAQFAQRVRLTAEQASVTAAIEWMICDDRSCMPPEDTELTVSVPSTASASTTSAEAQIWRPRRPCAPRRQGCRRKRFALGADYRGDPLGIRRPADPCVFPMVPMTVSYFLKGEGGAAMGAPSAPRCTACSLSSCTRCPSPPSSSSRASSEATP